MPVATAYASCGTTRENTDNAAVAGLDSGVTSLNSEVAGLVARARGGERQAWDALVERYAPLIWSICRKYRLGRADADDVGQNVWVRLVDQLSKLRDPAALPGWLATTTHRECWRVTRASCAPGAFELDTESIPDEQAEPADHELLAAERHAALREAFAHLPPAGQQLMALLIADPPLPYAEVSARLGIPVGSIGPTRSRCLDRMRRHPAIAALIDAESGAPRRALAAANLCEACQVFASASVPPADHHDRDASRCTPETSGYRRYSSS